jgi:hypothetical protein
MVTLDEELSDKVYLAALAHELHDEGLETRFTADIVERILTTRLGIYDAAL